METSQTATAIMEAAQELVQTRGYNAFSYRDLAERVGIRTASIHYHFPAKSDLGEALVRRYSQAVEQACEQIDREVDADDAGEKLRRFSALLDGVLRDGCRICLGGMMASDFATLPPAVQHEVTRFIAANEQWLARVLAQGRAAGTLTFAGDAETAAGALFSALEGAMFIARGCEDLSRYRHTADWLIGALVATPPKG
jgi:TetR/AcrR family transcriptional repressor of nem operon